MKLDISKQPKAIKDKFEKVKHLITDVEKGDSYRVTAQWGRRANSGYPPVEIINPNLGEALKDLETLSKT